MRRHSTRRFIKYLRRRKKPLEILEIGCGNGWLSAQLAMEPSWMVTGMDINTEELGQAKRVFQKYSNLNFIPGDLRQVKLNSRFDVILFAASIQYFPFLAEIVGVASDYLKPGGEIHIIDTVFYAEEEVEAAMKRSESYYISLGYPEAARFYFHHTREELGITGSKILYDPRTFMNKLFRKNPFYWACKKRQ